MQLGLDLTVTEGSRRQKAPVCSISIGPDTRAKEVELALKQLYDTKKTVIHVRLFGFEKIDDSLQKHIVILIVSLSEYGHDVVVFDDDAKDWDLRSIARYLESLLGISICVFANAKQNIRLFNKNEEEIPKAVALKAKFIVDQNKGILERGEGAPLSRSVCSFDPEYPEPRILDGATWNSGIFSEKIAQIYISVNPGAGRFAGSSNNVLQGANERLFRFLFEVQQNSYEHGRYGKRGERIHGLRYLQISHKTFHSASGLRNEWSWFRELMEFAEPLMLRESISSFLLFAISDFGCGILEKFLSQRPEFKRGDLSYNERRALLNRILIDESMTTKSRGSIAEGAGLQNALTAVSQMQGFVSLRTGKYWMQRSFRHQEAQPNDLSLFESKIDFELAEVSGTHWLLVLPLP